jgi:signal transduction histidine kinase
MASSTIEQSTPLAQGRGRARRWPKGLTRAVIWGVMAVGICAPLGLALHLGSLRGGPTQKDFILWSVVSLCGSALVGLGMHLRAQLREAQRQAGLTSELNAMLDEHWIHPIEAGATDATPAVLASLNRLIDFAQERENLYSDLLITNCVLTNELKLFHQVLNAINVGLVGIDANNNLVFANRCAQPFFKQAFEELCGMDVSRGLNEPAVAQLLEEAGGIHSAITRELEPDPARGRGYVSLTRYSVLDGEDQSCGKALVIQDIDRQKTIERLQTDFLDNVAHEFRTPLTSIIASVELLIQTQGKDIKGRERFYNIIHEETYRLSTLIDNLLNMSMIERGALGLNLTPTRLKKFIDDVLEVVRPLCEQKNIELIAHLPERLPTMDLDKSLFNVAVMNIVGNAVKYTPNGGKVLIELTSLEDSFGLIVEDTGYGIPEADQQRIFEKFYRVAREDGEDIKGNGIGLAFARQIVRMHGGEIKLASKLGEGSRFTILLPRKLINNAIGD